MSCSSLYGIKADYTGEILCEYKNSWWFSPVVWSVLSDKTLPKVMGYIQRPMMRYKSSGVVKILNIN